LASHPQRVTAVQGVFFDLDGCLVDSRRAVTAAVNAALTGHGLEPLEEPVVSKLIGPPLPAIFAKILSNLRPSREQIIPSLVSAYRRAYGLDAANLTKIVDGVFPMLDTLSMHGAALFVCTSKPQPVATSLVRDLGLSRWFKAIFGPAFDDEMESKSVTLHRGLRYLAEVPASGVRRSPAAIIGDRYHDIEAGIANGIVTIGVTWGSGSRDELLASHADAIVDHPSEVPHALNEFVR